MPRVVIDLRMVEGPLHGIARYALELAHHLPRLEPTWEFIGLTGPTGLPENLGSLLPDIRLVACRAGFLSPLEQPALAATLFQLKPDLFHATSFSVPRFWPGRLVATLHDANHLALKSQYGPLQAAYFRHIVAPRAAKATRLITISEFSKKELSGHLSLTSEAFDVIPQGVDASFRAPSFEEVNEFKTRHRLPQEYFAVVGNSKRYKNLEVFQQLPREPPLPLVALAGPTGLSRMGPWRNTKALPALTEADLRLFYAGATALLFPSLYEGFGLPVLEAMACGCPVVASDAGALPEIVSDAGLLADPQNAEEWHRVMNSLANDSSLRQSLKEKGLARASAFTWERTSNETRHVYRLALSPI